MRVIGGSARGTKLHSPSSEETRPITDRAKEALFNILMFKVPGCRFLDLFAGTGGVGIEALSRGAEHSTFIELSKVIFADLKWNIARTRFDGRSTVINGDAFKFLEGERRQVFDVIFVAPPQWKNMCQQAMDALSSHLNLLAEEGIIVTQHDPTEVVSVDSGLLVEYDKRIYGGVQFNFYKKNLGKQGS